MIRRQAVRLLPWRTAWQRAGKLATQLGALYALWWLFILTATDVAVVYARAHT